MTERCVRRADIEHSPSFRRKSESRTFKQVPFARTPASAGVTTCAGGLRRILFTVILLATFLVTGGAAPGQVAPAASAREPQASLSGVLDLPAAEPRSLPVKDPFRPPIEPRTANQDTSDKATELPPLLLTAVMQGSTSVAAVVNGTILRPGDTFLDMLVLEIAKNRVLFQRGEGKVTLFMQEKLYNPLSLGGK